MRGFSGSTGKVTYFIVVIIGEASAPDITSTLSSRPVPSSIALIRFIASVEPITFPDKGRVL